MLSIARKDGQQVVLLLPSGEQVWIVVKRDNDRVQLGISAPKEVKILRSELLYREANKNVSSD